MLHVRGRPGGGRYRLPSALGELPVPADGAGKRGHIALEVSGVLRKILTANLPPFYRVLPDPSGYLGTPEHISTLATNSLITKLLSCANPYFSRRCERTCFSGFLGS